MKKKLKFIIITVITVIIILGAAVLIYMRPMFSMTPVDTGTVSNTDIIAVQDAKNSIYFIPADKNYIAVDAGTSAGNIKKSMEQMEIDPLDVTAVLLTHTDSDHTGALELFSNAAIYMNEEEMQMIDGSTKRNAFFNNSVSEDVRERMITTSNKEVLELYGYQITCINSSGHTPGSMSFMVDDQYLFTGDAICIKNKEASVHPYTMDKETSLASIEELLDVNKDTVIFTAHYGVYHAAEIAYTK